MQVGWEWGWLSSLDQSNGYNLASDFFSPASYQAQPDGRGFVLFQPMRLWCIRIRCALLLSSTVWGQGGSHGAVSVPHCRDGDFPKMQGFALDAVEVRDLSAKAGPYGRVFLTRAHRRGFSSHYWSLGHYYNCCS